MLGRMEDTGYGFEFGGHEQAHAGDLGETDGPFGGSLRAVRRGERIHDVHVAERGQLAGHFLIILLFALVEAHVLAQDAFTGLYADAVQIVLLKPDRNAEQFLKRLATGASEASSE